MCKIVKESDETLGNFVEDLEMMLWYFFTNYVSKHYMILEVQNVKGGGGGGGGGGLSTGPATQPRKSQATMETTTEEKSNSREKEDSALLEAKMAEVYESRKEVNSLKNFIFPTKTTSKM